MCLVVYLAKPAKSQYITVRTAKIVLFCLSVSCVQHPWDCHSNGWGYPFKKIFSCLNNCCYPFEKKSPVRTAEIYNLELKTIAFRTAEVFRTAKGIRSDSAFRNALDLSNCHTLVTKHLIFQRYCSKDVKIFVVSFTFTVQKSMNNRPKQNFRTIVKPFPA